MERAYDNNEKNIQIEMFLNLDRYSKENIDSELTLNLELAVRPVQSLENIHYEKTIKTILVC